ncbi:MAG TPA: EAL domain-containing protein [Dermatophilaceae bacterium]|nr:EAL domain-containing protein [Dermatophilaceae bacterium]
MSSLSGLGHPATAQGLQVPLSARAPFHKGLVRVMGLLAFAYVAGLALHGVGWSPAVDGWLSTVVDGWLGLLTVWVPTAVCWVAVWRVGFRRWEVLLAAAAVTSYATGDLYYVVMSLGGGSLPFPSLADLGYLSFYPLMVAALVMAVHRCVRGVALSVWLDGAVGSLGATSVLAVLLSPVLAAATVGPPSLATAVAVANPMFDLLLVAAVAGIAALRDVRMGSRWGLLLGGLLIFAAADVSYGLQVTAGTYVLGSPLDAGWAIGIALMAMWVDGAAQREGPAAQETSSATGAAALAVSTAATAAGLGVLLVSSRTQLSILAVTLAGMTLLAAAVRTQLAFRLLARMADLRRAAAITDDLTGLPNRRALYAEGQSLLADPRRRRRALLMMDLDKFKEVNDCLGHHAGDLLLFQVGARLREHLRAGDVLSRLGGDEFAVLLQDADHDQAAEVAAKLCAAVAESFVVDGLTLHSSVSIGVALFPGDGADLSTLLRKADIAMYQAKTSGRGHCFCADVDEANDANDRATRLQTVEELRTALISDQFVAYFQPKIDLDTGEVHAVEALVRWDHPTRGLLYPDDFLSLVETSGLMPSLTRVVLTIALDQVATWHAQGQHLTVAVNLSASSLADTDLPERVFSMLDAAGVSPSALQLEITEEFLMADHDRARTVLTRLRLRGIQISIDDYGTGYSSLSYLRDLPIDELKLDRSFVRPMAEDARASALVASTVGLAHVLGLRLVAEGVETDVAYRELRHLGCDQAQGNFMCAAVPAAELDHWLSARRTTDQGSAGPLVNEFDAQR